MPTGNGSPPSCSTRPKGPTEGGLTNDRNRRDLRSVRNPDRYRSIEPGECVRADSSAAGGDRSLYGVRGCIRDVASTRDRAGGTSMSDHTNGTGTEKRNKRGRPTVLTEAVQATILANLRAGNYLATSCRAAGISPRTLETWRQRHREGDPRADRLTDFVRCVKKAISEGETDLLGKVRAGGPGWQSAAWILERRWRDRWGRNPNVVVSSATTGYRTGRTLGTGFLRFRRRRAGSVPRYDAASVWLVRVRSTRKSAVEYTHRDGRTPARVRPSGPGRRADPLPATDWVRPVLQGDSP